VTERVRLVISPFRAFLHLEADAERRQALAAVSGLLEPGGRFVFDVFAPSTEDIEETNGRWLEREPGIWELALWDLSAASSRCTCAARSRILPQPRLAPERVAHSPRGRRLRDRRLLRLVRPAPVRRRRGFDLARAPP
jgi:hypothetical protein